MNAPANDHELLQRYARTGCEEAFTTLVNRYLNPVYSIALRECANPQEAEELTQATFIILARKAPSLGSNTVLSGWLFQTVRYTARNARRSELRRVQRNQLLTHDMAFTAPESDSHSALWEEIAPRLNEAIAALGRADRDTILLRFFEQKSHAEIAAATHTSEASARKRLSRAVDRLRGVLSRLGVVVPAAMLASLLSTHTLQAAPPSLGVAGVVAAGTAATGTASPAVALAANTLHGMMIAKVKALAVAAAALVLAGGSTALLVRPVPAATEGRSQKLADGSVLTVTSVDLTDQVTYHYQASEPAWVAVARRVLPDTWARRVIPFRSSGSIGLSSASGTESLYIATTQEGRPARGAIDIGRARIAADDGTVFEGIFNAGTMAFDHDHFNAWHFDAFPRRTRNLRVEFFHPMPDNTWALDAAITVPNPAKGPFDTWTARPLPLTATNGSLTATLSEFVAGGPQLRTNRDHSPFWSSLPSTRWTIEAHDRTEPATTWMVRSIEIADGTGNRWTPFSLLAWRDPAAESGIMASMVGALWTNEPAWDLHIELSKADQFQPGEMATASGIDLPEDGESADLHTQLRVGNVVLELVALTAPHGKPPEAFQWMGDNARMNLGVRARGDLTGKRISLVRVTDNQGRPVPFTDHQQVIQQPQFVIEVSPAEDARSLGFTFAVGESRYVDFRARPTPGASARR